MQFLELAKKRSSVRSYQTTPVEREKLLAVLEAGRIAPSAVNYQPWYFVVLEEEAIRKKVAAAYPKDWVLEAPVLIVICGDHQHSWKRKHDQKDHCDIDVAIAVTQMTLAATELGLGTCWICAFDPKVCRETLDLPEQIEPIAILTLGYPKSQADPDRHSKERKELNAVVRWNGFY